MIGRLCALWVLLCMLSLLWSISFGHLWELFTNALHWKNKDQNRNLIAVSELDTHTLSLILFSYHLQGTLVAVTGITQPYHETQRPLAKSVGVGILTSASTFTPSPRLIRISTLTKIFNFSKTMPLTTNADFFFLRKSISLTSVKGVYVIWGLPVTEMKF